MARQKVEQRKNNPLWSIAMVLLGVVCAFGSQTLPEEIRNFSLGGFGVREIGYGFIGFGLFMFLLLQIDALSGAVKGGSGRKDRRETIKRRRQQGTGVNYNGPPRPPK